MLLAKLPIPEGWVDMGIGESSVLYGNALTLLSKKIIKIPTNLNLKYLPPAGYPPLVKTLESKYKLPAIVTVGAKQGLLASFLTLKRLGVTHIVTTRPYWTSFPAMCELCGLSFSAYDSWETLDSIVETTKIAYLVVSPNNPDGSTAGPNLIDRLKSRGHYVIHDAAYESKAYGFDLTNHNYDIKIYSSSKQLGMSSSRDAS
jgi:aspartate/methionine/tyrosine aminotransferase